MRLIGVLVIMFGFLFNSSGEALKINDAIPTISSIDQNGETVDLPQLGQDSYLLVYFYPKADTPGCTKQACSLRDAYEQIQQAGIQVVGVSMDSVVSQKNFTEKFKLPFILLADEEGDVVDAFGVPKLKMGDFPSRQAYLFYQGKLVWKDDKASTSEQAADVLAVVKKRQ